MSITIPNGSVFNDEEGKGILFQRRKERGKRQKTFQSGYGVALVASGGIGAGSESPA
jgi:hypothetical protein